MNGSSKVVILVADDEELVRNLVGAIVRADGYHVLIASDGIEALDLSRRYAGHIDLLISDFEMPGMTGVELANAVAIKRPKTKVLLISGSADIEIPHGFHFLRKPFVVDALRQRIAGLLAARGNSEISVTGC
jgi:two-component system cell cycle sensor histidine kinase/response regulator CckA